MRNFYTIIVLFLFCIISACNKDKTNESEAIDNKVSLSRKEMIAQRWQGRIDTVSYAIGVDVAMRLEQQFDKINYERINQAIADYYSGSKLYLSDKERVEAINTYNKLLAPKFKMDQEKKNIEEGAAFFKSNKNNPGIIEHKSGIQYKIIKNSEGMRPNQSDIVSIHYIGKLIDGTKFDSSYDRNQPSTIPLSRLIPGWSQGIQLMSVGSTFQFFIPGHLAYGQEVGPGGAMATLIFQVELLEVIRQAD
tara:strand:+ start:3077 stop:3823 length:747 start_codon:yes stop_codon:yes gene_type:complete